MGLSGLKECLFCRIVSKAIPATIVFEDTEILAFKDIHPQAPTHVLFIPKRHFDSVNEMSEGQNPAADLILAATQYAKKIKIDLSGYRLVFNHGAHGGQTVEHLHLHLLGGRSLVWPPG